MTHLGTVLLETDRLTLRRFTLGDAQEVFENWMRDEDTLYYTAWNTHGSVAETILFLHDWVDGYKNLDDYHWAIESQETFEVIGFIGCYSVDGAAPTTIEVGYCLGKEFWGKGLMTEALQCVLNFFKTEVGYQKVIAKVDVLNIGSYTVLEKCGFKRKENYMTKGIRKGMLYDCLEYRLSL